MANQEKTIDPRILELLGLQDVSDLDYGEYKTLLKEAMVKNHPDRGGNLDDFKLLSIERDKVKNEDDKGKVKGKKEGAKSFVSRLALPGGGVKPVPDIKPSENLLEPPDDEEKEDNVIVKGLKSVLDSLKGIADLLSDQFKFDKDAHAAAVKRQKAQDKKDREAELEAKKKSEDQKKSLNIGFKAPQPLTNIFDAFKKFFGNILAGGVVVGLLDWLSKNEGKIEEFTNWLTENINGILIGLAALAVLPIALTLLNLGAALVSGISLLMGPLGWIFSAAGLMALAVVASPFAWSWLRDKMAGGQQFRQAEKSVEKELLTYNILPEGKVVDDQGNIITKGGPIFGVHANLRSPEEREWLIEQGHVTQEQLDAWDRAQKIKADIEKVREEMRKEMEEAESKIRNERYASMAPILKNSIFGDSTPATRRMRDDYFKETQEMVKIAKQRIRAKHVVKIEQYITGSHHGYDMGLDAILNPPNVPSDQKDQQRTGLLSKDGVGDTTLDTTNLKSNSSSSVAPGPSTRKINVSTLPIPAKDSSGSSSSDSVANQTEIAYVRPEDPNNTSRDAIEGIFNLTGVG